MNKETTNNDIIIEGNGVYGLIGATTEFEKNINCIANNGKGISKYKCTRFKTTNNCFGCKYAELPYSKFPNYISLLKAWTWEAAK